MHPGIRSILGLVSALTLAITIFGTASSSTSLSAPGAPVSSASCTRQARFQAVTIDVPVNGAVSFGVQELLASTAGLTGCFDVATLGAAIAHVPANGGYLTARSGNAFLYGDTLAGEGGEARTRFVYTPARGFSGVSEGWSLSIHTAGAGPQTAIGLVMVTFLVRNSLPVALDDFVVVTPGLAEIVVSAEAGVLANDFDINGDRITVHSHGVTRYPWGTVEIRRDGSFRVLITDPEAATGSAQVRYVVWDNEGSPTSTDFGALVIRFDE